MSDWQKVPLGDLLTRITYGFTNPMPTTEFGPSMVTAKDIRNGRIDYSTARFTSQEAFDNLTDKSRPRIGDVLLTKDGSIGRVAVCDRPNVCINQSVALLQPNGRVLSEYLAYLLQAPEYQEKMAADADGSTIKHIYITRVDKMAVMLPSMSVQRAIADVLSALDDKIAANTKLATTADELARSEAIRLMRESSTQVLLGDIAELSYGKALPATRRVPGPYPVYGSGGIGGYHNGYLESGPGVILGRKGSVGEVYWSEEAFFPIDTTFFVVPKAQVPLSYLYYAVEQQKFGENSSDSAVPGLNREDAYRTRVPVPDGASLAGFDELAVWLRRMVHQAEVESGRLAATRDALLPALISGRLTVRDAESTVESAVDGGAVEPEALANGTLW